MMLDAAWAFDATPKTVTATGNSTNVNDQGSAKKLFDGTGRIPFRISGFYKGNSGTNPTIRVQFVGADDAALTSNVLVIADTGVSPVLSAGVLVPFELVPQLQTAAKRFYGLIYTLAGTTPNIDVMAVGVLDGQSAYPAQKAAVP